MIAADKVLYAHLGPTTRPALLYALHTLQTTFILIPGMLDKRAPHTRQIVSCCPCNCRIASHRITSAPAQSWIVMSSAGAPVPGPDNALCLCFVCLVCLVSWALCVGSLLYLSLVPLSPPPSLSSYALLSDLSQLHSLLWVLV